MFFTDQSCISVVTFSISDNTINSFHWRVCSYTYFNNKLYFLGTRRFICYLSVSSVAFQVQTICNNMSFRGYELSPSSRVWDLVWMAARLQFFNDRAENKTRSHSHFKFMCIIHRHIYSMAQLTNILLCIATLPPHVRVKVL